MRVEPPTMTTSSIWSGVSCGVFEGLLDGGGGALDDGRDELFVLGAGDFAGVGTLAVRLEARRGDARGGWCRRR